jgi:serine/threonine-protein kinase RsbW
MGSSMMIRMQLSLPRDARYVGMLRDVANCILSDLDAPTPAREDIELAVTEACANAVRHATGATDYTVTFAVNDHECEVEVADLGPGFELETVERTRAGAADEEQGRGLLLIEALVDNCEFFRQEQGTRLRLIKRWNGLNLSPADGVDEGWKSTGNAIAGG